jgi:hypothetical protein
MWMDIHIGRWCFQFTKGEVLAMLIFVTLPALVFGVIRYRVRTKRVNPP